MKASPLVALLTVISLAQIKVHPVNGAGLLDLDVVKDLGHTGGSVSEFVDTRKVVMAYERASSRSSGSTVRGFPGAVRRSGPPINADFCFLVDITGSMQPHITAVKESIRDFVNFVKTKSAVGTVRLCFVGYRDFGDHRQIQTLPFTTDLKRFMAFVDGIKETGGHDGPEDVFSGLEEIAKQKWQSRKKRVVLHMADYPCHGEGCGGGTGDKKRRSAYDVFRGITANRIKYRFGKITSRTDTMIDLFREAYGYEIKLFNVLPETIMAARTRSFFRSRTSSRSRTAYGASDDEEEESMSRSINAYVLQKKVEEASIAALLLD